jgi:hypothetical protein
MNTATTTFAPADSCSRPGLTSLIRTGRGLMTVQTELVGEPAALVTIVDFRGRVLKSWKSSFSIASTDLAAPAAIRRWHNDIEARVRDNLARAANKRPSVETGNEVVSHLFVAAVEAYRRRDLETARAVMRACELLLPDDPRIRAGALRLRA